MSPDILIDDFGSRLSAGFVLKAVEVVTVARERELAQKGKQIENYPLLTAPTCPAYGPDFQTIIVNTDWPRAV